MPWVMPTTVASEANSGYGGRFGYGSPIVYIAEVKSCRFPRYTVPKLNRTHLLSPNTTEEYTPGLIDPGAIDFTGNFIGDVTQLADIDTLVLAQTVFTWAFTFPVQNRTLTCTIPGSGFWTKFDLGPIEPNRPTEFAATVQTTGYSTVMVA